MLILTTTISALLTAQIDSIQTHWSFDSIQNGMVTENSLGLNGEIEGATLTQGALHGGLYFDGVDDVVTVNGMNAVRKTLGSLQEGTLSAWFRFDHNPGFMDIETIFYLGCANEFSSYGTSVNAFELEVGHFSAQRRLYWTLISTEEEQTSVPYCWSTTEHLNTGKWYHVVSTTSQELGTRVYLNNVEIYDSTDLTWNFGDESMCRFLGDVTDQEVLWFGKGLWNNMHQYYEGAIDEVRVWSNALSAEEVEQEYERVASVGALSISPKVQDELVVQQDVQLYGSFDNIVKLVLRVNDEDVLVQQNNSLESNWSIIVDANALSAGRNEVRVRGFNAANRIFDDSRILIQPDLTNDGVVDINDVLSLLGQWGACDCAADFTGNGSVEVNDLLLLIEAWS